MFLTNRIRIGQLNNFHYAIDQLVEISFAIVKIADQK